MFDAVLFFSYMLIPFLFELRSLLDWMFTETSMSLLQWIKMEDIFTNVYVVKVCKLCVLYLCLFLTKMHRKFFKVPAPHR